MKVIIDIDDNVYEWVKNTGTFGIYRFNTAKAIKNGTPLDEYMVKAEKENFIQTCEVFRERIDEV